MMSSAGPVRAVVLLVLSLLAGGAAVFLGRKTVAAEQATGHAPS